MRVIIRNFIATLALFILSAGSVFSQVVPPNYSFTLDQLAAFGPGKSLLAIQARWGPGKLLERRGGTRTIRFELSHIRYRFPVLVQVQGDRVTDFFISLPSYFLHDIFHQSLINRYGRQDNYLLREGHDVYQWNNRAGGLTLTYAGACTITCFPLYYAVHPSDPPEGLPGYRSILQTVQFHEDF